MLRLTFRTKLILTTTLLVLGLTLVTFRSTRREIRDAYSLMLQTQFRSQVEYFSDQQQQRQEMILRRCEALAADPELAKAIKTNAADVAITFLASDISNLVNSVWGSASDAPETSRPEPPPALSYQERRRALDLNQVPRLTEQPFVGLLDPDGYLLASTMPRPGGGRPQEGAGSMRAFPQRREGQRGLPKDVQGPRLKPGGEGGPGGRIDFERERFRWFEEGFRKFISTERQVVGFTVLSTPRGDHQLREVILTPVKAELSEPTPALMLVGYPLPNFAERSLTNYSPMTESSPRIFSGVWYDARVFSKSIPSNVWEMLSGRIADHMDEASDGRGSFEFKFDGGSYELIYTVLNPNSPMPKAVQFALYSLDPFEEDVRELMLQIASYDAVALALAVLLSFFVSHSFSVGIRDLTGATRRIRAGDFAVQLRVRSRDEVGELAESFNEMAEGLAHRERLHTALNLVADPDVAEQFASGKIELGGELRTVSVIFCDIRGFTALSQGMDPAEVVHLLNAHMTALTKVVSRHGGIVDKFIGDSIMAIFGAPKQREDDVLNAARCGLEMIAARAELNRSSGQSIEIGVGIATGPVLAGNMGSDDRMNYTVIGERVNLSARLCSQAGAGEVLIDDVTRKALGDRITVETGTDFQLKGFTGAVIAYKLRSVGG